MELGNMVWGNSRGEFSVPRTVTWEGAIVGLIAALYGPDETTNGFENFENEVFAIRTYYWGDCACGYEAAAEKWHTENCHTQDCYQAEYQKIGEAYGHLSKESDPAVKALCKRRGIAWNKGFGSGVHCDCGFQGKWEKWASDNHHKPDCPMILPNFHHKASGFELKWYKYPLRDSYMSQNLTFLEFKKLVDDAHASIKKRG